MELRAIEAEDIGGVRSKPTSWQTFQVKAHEIVEKVKELRSRPGRQSLQRLAHSRRSLTNALSTSREHPPLRHHRSSLRAWIRSADSAFVL